MNNKRIVSLVIAALGLIVLTLFLVNKTKTNNGVEVTIKVAPKDSIMLVDGSIKVVNGSNWLQPGMHSIVFKRAGFSENKIQFLVTKTGPNLVLMILKHNSDEGKKYADENKNDFSEIEGLGNEEAARLGKSSSENYPLINKLPIDMRPMYRIDFGVSKKFPGDTSKIAIYIGSNNPTDKFDAVKKIYEMGYDPSDYEVVFRGLK